MSWGTNDTITYAMEYEITVHALLDGHHHNAPDNGIAVNMESKALTGNNLTTMSPETN